MFRFTFRAVSFVLMLAGLSRAQAAPDFTAAQAEAVKFLADLVKIDTSNPPGNETRAAEYIKVAATSWLASGARPRRNRCC
jgi:acetylornithine deacetylase/succinyl-diaminopimelate desuccinylase-like protein